ncbi:alpha/beta hydrolase family protein [Patescibacteria group bacterium]
MNSEKEKEKNINIFLIIFIAIFSSLITFLISYFLFNKNSIISPIGDAITQIIEREKLLEKYSFENLANSPINKSEIVLGEIIKEEERHSSYNFFIEVEGQKVSGQINIPKIQNPTNGFPVLVMNRGFIDPEIYQTGMGTKNAAGYFARNGFITIAPDFLGFGESDQEDANPMAARVKKPVTTITILNSISSLNQFTKADRNNIFMWGHSNGGQISLSVLEILGKSPYWNKEIPTTLWAPVSKGFPYNILYYTDDGDYGKALRKVLFEFELDYDTDKYSIHKYFDWVNSPIQIHQGTSDIFIPTSWSDDLVKKLKENEIKVKYYKYQGADHNLKPSWGVVVERDLVFFKSYIQ